MKSILLLVAGIVAGFVVGFYLADDSGESAESAAPPTETEPAGSPSDTPTIPASIGRITLDEAACTYEGDDTPKAPFFSMDVNNQTSSFSHVEVDRIPADVTTDEVEEFFEQQQGLLERGEAFRGPPEEWRLNRRAGMGTGTGSMLVGDPTFPDQMLVAGQRYVVWCSTGEPPTRIFFAGVLEPSE